MKILLFTHEQDIDGMGSIIIASCAFSDFDYITCKTFEVNQKVSEVINDGSIASYDFVYVTDICIKEPLLSQINADSVLRSKFLILDHHKSEIDEGNDKYSFVKIIVSNKNGKQSGTSLFYNHLMAQQLLNSKTSLDEIVELTRQYDTWEWHDIYHNSKARMLHILFEQLGYQEYLRQMIEMVQTQDEVKFSEQQLTIIDKFECQLEAKLTTILKDMIVLSLDIEKKNYRVGFVKCNYQYRNDLPDMVLRDNKENIDLLGMIIVDRDTVSYRKIRNVDVSKVAVYFGGKGHIDAASNPQSNENFQKVLASFPKKIV